MNLLVTEFRLFQNFRLKLELDKLFNSLPLQQNFWTLFVNGDTELVFLRKKKGVGLGREVEAQILKQRAEPGRLIQR
jgi:hypothetical protein